jgi:hypothetical protein
MGRCWPSTSSAYWTPCGLVGSTSASHARLAFGRVDHDRAWIAEHRDLTVRVLSNDVYGNPARGNSLLIFGFGERGAPIGYSEAVLGPAPTTYDHERDTTAMLRAFHRVWERAVSRKESGLVIKRMLEAT